DRHQRLPPLQPQPQEAACPAAARDAPERGRLTHPGRVGSEVVGAPGSDALAPTGARPVRAAVRSCVAPAKRGRSGTPKPKPRTRGSGAGAACAADGPAGAAEPGPAERAGPGPAAGDRKLSRA